MSRPIRKIETYEEALEKAIMTEEEFMAIPMKKYESKYWDFNSHVLTLTFRGINSEFGKGYEVDLEEFVIPWGILSLLGHLLEKTWFTDEVAGDFIRTFNYHIKFRHLHRLKSGGTSIRNIFEEVGQ